MRKILLFTAIVHFCVFTYAQELPVITVLDFAASNISKEEALLLVDYLSSGIVESGKYRVIDRTQREALLSEQKFSLSAEADDTTKEFQLEIGKLLSAKFIIVGSVGDVSDVFLINVKLIDVETGEALRTVSEKYSSMKSLIDDSESLLNRLLGFSQKQNADNRISKAQDVTQLEKKLERMKGNINKDKYLSWVAEVDMIDIETNGTVEEKIQLVEYYKQAIQVKGLALEIHIGKNFGDAGFNLGPGISYQLNSLFSVGLNTYFTYVDYYNGNFPFDFLGGPKVILFNKVGGIGLALHGLVGIYHDPYVQVTGGGGVGIYFRNLYIDLLMSPGNWGDMTIDLNFGYSFFFGKKP